MLIKTINKFNILNKRQQPDLPPHTYVGGGWVVFRSQSSLLYFLKSAQVAENAHAS
jgi:hypothetical protein